MIRVNRVLNGMSKGVYVHWWQSLSGGESPAFCLQGLVTCQLAPTTLTLKVVFFTSPVCMNL